MGAIRHGRPLGRRETQVLTYVQAEIGLTGVAPSYGMICTQLGIAARNDVHRIVKRLEELGYVRRAGSGRVRRIRLAVFSKVEEELR